MPALVYYVAVSLDGYIAGPDGQFDAFLMEGDHMDGINQHYPDTIPTAFAGALGIDQSQGPFDTVVMGANTYAMALPDYPSPYQHLDQYVFTHRPYPEADGVTFTDRDPATVVREARHGRERTSGCAAAATWRCNSPMRSTGWCSNASPCSSARGYPCSHPAATHPSGSSACAATTSTRASPWWNTRSARGAA